MIGEAGYIEMMKNCSNWNSRIESERKRRYPVLDAQTGIAQRPSLTAIRTIADRYPATNPSQYCTYVCKRWKKRKTAASSDATEMKYIVQCNPAINEVLNQAAAAPQTDFSAAVETPSQSAELLHIEKRVNKIVYEPTFENDLEDASEEEPVEASDEDDWSEGKRKRKRRNAGGSTRERGGARKSAAASASNSSSALSGNTQMTTSGSQDPKPFACHQCGARYKSRPGLNYHRAHVHPEMASPCGTPQPPHLISPNIEISTICDLCLGDCNENKKTSQPEQLVSCHDCGRSGHPSCLKFTDNMITSTTKYGWQCIECKSCAICGFSDNDDQLLFCDDCDRGFHLYCLRPRLATAPEGEWSCHLCQKEFGSKASLPASK